MARRIAAKALNRAGHSHDDVANLTGVKSRTVRRIAKEKLPETLSDSVARRNQRIGRPSKVEPVRAQVEDILKKEPEIHASEVLRRVGLKGYEGQKSQLYKLVSELRPVASPRLITRFEGLAGEFCQHDFGQLDVSFRDGTTQRIHFFASRLKWSRWAQVSVVPDERAETLCRALVSHYQAMGGAPLFSVFDRPKTVALAWGADGHVTEWNPLLLQTTAELGTSPIACWPYQPQQKGSIENLVGWTKGSFFKPRSFDDSHDLLVQLSDWHIESNERRPSRATGVPPGARIARERALLKPLRVTPETFVFRFPTLVGSTGYVTFEGRRYSMPPQAIGLSGTLYLGAQSVRLVAGPHGALHPRLATPRGISTLPEHRSLLVEAAVGRGKDMLRRQQLLDLGPEFEDYLTTLVHRRPKSWPQDVLRLHGWLLSHGESALRSALCSAAERSLFGAEYVVRFLNEG